MDNVKPWQIILFLVAIGALGFSVWKFGGSGAPSQPDSILLVDVMTGELFDTHKGAARGILLPARHPETGERTLFPVEQTENGRWQLRRRYTPMLEQMGIDSRLIRGDYEIEISNESPTKYTPSVPSD